MQYSGNASQYEIETDTDLYPKLGKGSIIKILIPLIKRLSVKSNEPDSDEFDLEDENTPVAFLSAIILQLLH